MPHIPDSLLQDVRDAVEAAHPNRDRGSLDEACHRLVSTLWKQRCCTPHEEEAMKVLRDAVLRNAEVRHLTYDDLNDIGFLAVLEMELFSDKVRRRNVVLCGELEARAWAAMQLAVIITPDMAPFLQQTHGAIQWIKHMFLHEELCPNPRLRLEMIRYMQVWPEDELRGHFIMALPHELVGLVCHLKLRDLLPLGKPSLSGPIVWLLKTCARLGCLSSLSSLCLIQVSQLIVTFETYFFCRLVRLQGQKARALRHMCFNGAASRLVMVREFTHLVDTLYVLFSVPACMCVYKVPGLVQVASNALAAVTINLYKCAFVLRATQTKFKRLTETLNKIYNKIRLGNKVLWTDLGNRHTATLARAADIANAVGCPLLELSIPLVVEEGLLSFPDHHRDAITDKVMTDPVRVICSYFGSGIVVDFSTLMAFMLVPRDPIIPSIVPIIPLPALGEEIARQRASASGAANNLAGTLYVRYQHLPKPDENGYPLFLTVDRVY